MPVKTLYISLNTRGDADIIDITERIVGCIVESGLNDGIVTVFCPSSTSALTTIEYERGCLSDLRRLFDEIVNPDREYATMLPGATAMVTATCALPYSRLR